ncbi:MAG: response regulator [Hylemonella sp.]|nr:response regulator [Hylemonella sp.]
MQDITPASHVATARILMVDDEPTNLRLADAMLRTAGYQNMIMVQDPRTALARYAEAPVDLIVLDLNMPELDGYALMDQFKALADPLLPPILVLTAQGSREHLLRALQAGARDFVSKPFDRIELLMRVRNLIEAQLAHRKLFMQRDALEDRVSARTQELRDEMDRRQIAQQAQYSLLQEKEGLLHEVHHRVKNNLQVIVSLLRLEGNRSADTGTTAVLNDMQGRIRAMALLHESLYRSGTTASLDLGAYLKLVATQSFRANAPGDGSVRLELELVTAQLSMDQASPCGLLVNELVSNALKHGFPKGTSGEVRIQLTADESSGLLTLQVSDSGIGLPDDFELKRKESLGLVLAGDLARQIGGKLACGPAPTATFSVQFRPT